MLLLLMQTFYKLYLHNYKPTQAIIMQHYFSTKVSHMKESIAFTLLYIICAYNTKWTIYAARKLHNVVLQVTTTNMHQPSVFVDLYYNEGKSDNCAKPLAIKEAITYFCLQKTNLNRHVFKVNVYQAKIMIETYHLLMCWQQWQYFFVLPTLYHHETERSLLPPQHCIV